MGQVAGYPEVILTLLLHIDQSIYGLYDVNNALKQPHILIL